MKLGWRLRQTFSIHLGKLTLALALYFFSYNATAKAVGDTPTVKKVYVFEINQSIFPAAWRLTKNALTEANRLGADVVLLKLNTYGGDLASADSIHSALMRARPLTICWITQNAASAGALVAISCDSIYMRSGALIGSASVVNQEGAVMPDKYQSYMRAMMRSTAERQGRDPKIAEGMVTPNNYLPEIADSNKVIALTAEEALRYNYCDGIVETVEAALAHAGIEPYELFHHHEDWLDRIIAFLLNPFVSSLLLLLILGGIYFEFQNPGSIFPIATAAVAAILYFAPLYLEGLAEHWEILLFIAGVILLGVELLILPGFGIAGIAGIGLILAGLTLALIRNLTFDFSFTGTEEILLALLRVLLPLGLFFALFLLFGHRISRLRLLRGIVLTDTLQEAVGYLDRPEQLKQLIGKTGVAVTPLRPAGIVELDGEQHDAMVDGAMIEKGQAIRVVNISGNLLVVRKA
ncbi:MAG: hypothetical protein NZL95_02020 [Chitinophagales bacterium]|nr:hypothetical protein [Chitinophagales bacterium]MDW8427310.1 NfeD family protein [Chitinophagales bacterium]